MQESLLENKKILIVDDEPDVLETLSEFLSMCELVEASTYKGIAKRHLRDLRDSEPNRRKH